MAARPDLSAPGHEAPTVALAGAADWDLTQPTGLPPIPGSLSGQMLNLLLAAQAEAAQAGSWSSETEAELAARMTALLEQALGGETPTVASPRPGPPAEG
ncbi:hypothetical protein [Falsiroseomonas tokyonensis]|uniref:DUF1844 domain-containing protein n=1 Tax=Falsiroseomonas tokyonensis TaxID=430521 RepID=A0ABV7BV39_9PROT|nr:hypothetical protein [Falsiroseomonas tokyonensis]MBU8539116.1 hypothetical protein [Falsiroseomonas tokyonensis]